jgi:2-polyprenyl-6-methoxyphenol hydroxylase-like FAD-dependent oxidoreductase
MLLARAGHRVLVVDRASFPSETVSTHMIHRPGVDALARWGLLDAVVATGCPPIDTYAYDLGPFTIEGSPGTAYAPRRTVLDSLLVETAARAGAEVRQGFKVDALVFEDGRVTGIGGHTKNRAKVTERARVVVGADGRHSFVARAVAAEEYNTKPELQASYYGYWAGLPMDGRFETSLRPGRGFAAWPTNDDLTLVIAGWPRREFEANRRDAERHFHQAIEAVAPAFADRIRDAQRVGRLVGASVRGWFRKPYGPGWTLVGDAGHHKDFITAQGIQDAFLDAETCAAALDAVLSGRRPFDEAMAEYRATRDARVRGMYELTAQLASLEPLPPDFEQLLAAVSRMREASDGFARVAAGVTSPTEFFSEENARRILAAARRAA